MKHIEKLIIEEKCDFEKMILFTLKKLGKLVALTYK